MTGLLITALTLSLSVQPIRGTARTPVVALPNRPQPTKSTSPSVPRAASTPNAAPVRPSLPKPGLLPFLGAALPGILYPAGHLVMGDLKGHGRIMAVKGAGLGLIILGAIPLFLTNASPKVIHIPVYTIITGFGLFSMATMADMYGALFSGAPTGSPPHTLPHLEAGIGYRYIKDYLINNAHSAVGYATIRTGPLTTRLSATLTPSGGNHDAALYGSYRLYGPTATHPGDGFSLDLMAGVIFRRYKSEGFRTLTNDLFALMRLDLHGVHPTLRGSFAEMGAGMALRFTGYDALSTGITEDHEVIPLYRFGFGFYLGHGRGEILLYYDHRHDDELGGLAMGSGGDGVMGHWGVEGSWWFTRHLGLGAMAAAGSAYLFMVTLKVRSE